MRGEKLLFRKTVKAFEIVRKIIHLLCQSIHEVYYKYVNVRDEFHAEM